MSMLMSVVMSAQVNNYECAISLTERRKYTEALPYIKNAKTEVFDDRTKYLTILKCELQCDKTLDADKLDDYLSASKSLNGISSRDYWNDMLWVASYCFDVGDQVQAQELLKQAERHLSIYGKGSFQGKDTLQQILSLDLKGHIKSEMGLHHRAIAYYKQSSALKKLWYGNESEEYIESLIQIANEYSAYAKPEKSIEYHNMALSALSNNVKTRFRTLDKAEREEYWYSVLPYFEGTLDAAFFSMSNKNKQYLLTTAAYNAILLSKSALLSAEVLGKNYTYVTTSEIQSALDINDVCIEFFKTRTDNYGALVLKKEWSHPHLVRLKRTIKTDNEKMSFGDAIPYTPPTQENEEYRDFLTALGETIWPKELLDLLPKKSEGKVYYSTTGRLDLCPIECLPIKKYGNSAEMSMLEQYDMYRLSSTRELAIYEPNDSHILSHVSLLGGINYKLDSSLFRKSSAELNIASQKSYIRLRDSDFEDSITDGTALRESHFTNLPGSLHEIIEIDSLLAHKADMLTGRYAIKSGIDFFSIDATTIVLSTHGFDSKGIVGDNFGHGDPLMNCGILVAGADTVGAMSRYLFARQIVDIDLSGVRLMILASCNSIGSEIEKDGIYGMMRAMKLAGVHSVIATLWPISDTAANLFMTSLFEHLIKNNEGLHNAFCSARDETRAKYTASFYWSPFVLIDALQ